MQDSATDMSKKKHAQCFLTIHFAQRLDDFINSHTFIDLSNIEKPQDTNSVRFWAPRDSSTKNICGGAYKMLY